MIELTQDENIPKDRRARGYLNIALWFTMFLGVIIGGFSLSSGAEILASNKGY